jgi:hypothetical protein
MWSKVNKASIWADFDRMQKAIMPSECWTTKKDFFAEPVSEQRAYYNWMVGQCNEITAGPHWFGEDKDPDPTMLDGGYEI